MQQIQELVLRNFGVLLVAACLWTAAKFGWHTYRNRKLGIVFPPIKSIQTKFHECFASGSSNKTFWTKFGGARNCLKVTVTESEVWIRTFFPFTLLAADLDLTHRIPKSSIISIQNSQSSFRPSLLLDFRLPDGGERRLTLRLKHPEDFLSACQGAPPLPEFQNL